jgi:hypothetical protein
MLMPVLYSADLLPKPLSWVKSAANGTVLTYRNGGLNLSLPGIDIFFRFLSKCPAVT